MTLSELYLFTVILPNIHSFSQSLALIIPIIGLGGGTIGYFVNQNDGDPKFVPICRSIIKYSIFFLSLLIFGFVISPSSEQLYTVAGGYVATNTKDVAKLPDNVIKAANAWLEKAADEAEPKKSKQK